MFTVRGASLQRVNEFVFYELAIKVHPLTQMNLEVPIKYSDIVWAWSEARTALDGIYNQRPLQITTSAAGKLYQAINGIVPQDFDRMIGKLPPDPEEEDSLPYWTLSQVKKAAEEFETVLGNECQFMDTYFVSKKGTHSTKDLVENAHHAVPEPARSHLPDITKLDFDQAGRCLAFDVPTAAAFHLLRGTEGAIREYYQLVVPGPKQANPKMRNWGTYIRLLNAHGANPSITALLALLKDVYRNPVFHPEEVYTDERAQVLFGYCVSAVAQIESEILALKAKGGALQFPASGALALSNP